MSLNSDEAHYLKKLWHIAWPGSLSMLLFSLFDLVDLKWIGFLGTESVAAVSLCGNIIGVIFGFNSILYTGSLALFARFIGAKDDSSLRRAFHHSFLLGFLIGVLLAVCGWFGTQYFLRFFNLDERVFILARDYLKIYFLFFFFIFIGTPVWTGWIAVGKTHILFIFNLIGTSINLFLDPVFIFPRGKMLIGFFNMGVAGAAWASVVSVSINSLLFFLFIFHKDFPFPRPLLKDLKFSIKEMWRILRIGVPSSIAMLSRPLATVLLQRIIVIFGAGAIAGFGIGLRWLGLNWIFFGGLTMAVSTLTGQYLGANNQDETTAMMRKAFWVAGVFQIMNSIFYFIFADWLVSILEPSKETILAGAGFLRWVSLGMILSSIGSVAGSALAGAGNTQPAMWISIVANWIIKIPLSFILSLWLGSGIDGVWQAIFVSLWAEGALLIWWYKKGNWRYFKV